MMKSRVAGIVWAIAACAAATAAPILDGSHIKETTLDNGLHVVVKAEPAWGLVSLGFVVKAAPLQETQEQSGLADVVRHMMFEVGDKDEPALVEVMADLGVVFESYTSPDATQIRATGSAYALGEVLPLVVHAIFEPEFDQDTWTLQQKLLRQRLMDAEQRATGKLWRLLWETSFHTHPYGRPVAGTADRMATVDAQSLAAFHEAFYVPNNMSLIVVGDAQAQAIFDLAAEHLGAYPQRPLATEPVAPEPPQTKALSHVQRADTRATLVSYAWRGAGIDSKLDVCALDVIYALLGEGLGARLTRAFFEQDQIDAVPEVEFITKRDPGLFIVTCVTKPEAEYDTRDLVLAEIEKLRTERITAAELASAKGLIRSAYAFDNQTHSGQLGSMAFYEAIDSYQFAVDYVSTVESVTVDDVQRVAKQYLDPSHYTLVIIRPQVQDGAGREARLTP